MLVFTQPEDASLLERLKREQELDAAITLAPVNIKHGRDHAPDEKCGGIYYQQCGGGRRVLRKKIGGS